MLLYPILILPNWVHDWIFKILFFLLPLINSRVIIRINSKLNLVQNIKCDSKMILRDTYSNVISMLRFTTKFRKVTVEKGTKNTFQKLTSDSKYHVVFGIHSGAFELMHMVLSNNTKPTYVLTASLGKWIDPLILLLRRHPNTFYVKPDEYSLYHKRIISEPCIVAVLIDQSISPIKSCATIDDLSIPLFTQLVHKLYNKNFNVSSIECLSLDPMNHKVSIGNTFNSSNNQSLDDFIESEVTRIIEINPTQWIWHYPIREFF